MPARTAKLDADPNVKIPAAVKAGIARAEAHFKPAEPAPAEPAVTPPADPAAPAVAAATPPAEPAATSPATAVVTATPPAEPVTPGGNDWESRYKASQGRLKRAEGAVAELTTQVTSLQRVISTMQPSAAAPAVPAATRLVTADEEEDFGSEFLDVVGRRAEEKFSPQVAELKANVARLEAMVGNLGGSVALDARSRMFSTLDAQVPKWKEINDDQDFLSWLALPDTYSGVIRHELLMAAWERNDSPRVLAFFNGFLAEEAAVAPAPPVPDVPPGTPPAGKVPLETFAAPGRAKSAAVDTPTEKPTFTRVQISQFYLDKTSGKYRGREEEANRIEAQIFAAQGDGRIR